MPQRYEDTFIGGAQRRFQTTCWDEIIKARTLDETRRKDTVNELIKKYWKPVYCYLRRKKYSNEEAKDMTQGFFHEVVLGRDLIQKADEKVGKFRTFLLTALDRYTKDVYYKKRAYKRSPEGKILPLETDDVDILLETQSESDPVRIFHYAWASEVLEQVLNKVKEDCCKAHKDTHWKVFYAKVVNPILSGIEVPELKELCTKYGIENPAKASNMIAHVKDRFRATMKRNLRKFVQSDSEVEEEFNEILQILSKNTTR